MERESTLSPREPGRFDRDEVDLVAALRLGGPAADQAFEAIVRDYGPRLLAVARKMMPTEEDAQDVLQDAFLAAHRGVESFAGDARLSTWLHRITVNAGLMKLRAKRSRPELALDDLQPKFLPDGHHADWPAPWKRGDETAALEHEETLAIVRDAIARLPENYRRVVVLRDVEGRTTEETAMELRESENAVKIRLHRARAALRGLIDSRQRRSARA
jgi:RNA polymerase sigma-70 factor, ECF subfamily